MQLLYQGNHIFRFGITRHLDYQTHLQNSLELVFLLEGTCHARCGGLERQMVPGQLMAVFPNQIHSYDGSRDVRAVLLIVPPQPFLVLIGSSTEPISPERSADRQVPPGALRYLSSGISRSQHAFGARGAADCVSSQSR